ncbi:hypothetical protein [Candidatus Amarolinea dominans]|uniref:hypothetical protein n=1 Tax=Candidatus Amarolinea dominans TaxID=3140696 RepID=UPI001DB69F9E|nr:hypothetical protein [Anaerolineae bacterium]
MLAVYIGMMFGMMFGMTVGIPFRMASYRMRMIMSMMPVGFGVVLGAGISVAFGVGFGVAWVVTWAVVILRLLVWPIEALWMLVLQRVAPSARRTGAALAADLLRRGHCPAAARFGPFPGRCLPLQRGGRATGN